MISLLNFIRNISKHHFLDEEVLLNSIMDIHCSTEKEEADENWMAVDVKGGPFKIVHFADVINKWPPKRKDYRNLCKDLKFFYLRVVCMALYAMINFMFWIQ